MSFNSYFDAKHTWLGTDMWARVWYKGTPDVANRFVDITFECWIMFPYNYNFNWSTYDFIVDNTHISVGRTFNGNGDQMMGSQTIRYYYNTDGTLPQIVVNVSFKAYGIYYVNGGYNVDLVTEMWGWGLNNLENIQAYQTPTIAITNTQTYYDMSKPFNVNFKGCTTRITNEYYAVDYKFNSGINSNMAGSNENIFRGGSKGLANAVYMNPPSYDGYNDGYITVTPKVFGIGYNQNFTMALKRYSYPSGKSGYSNKVFKTYDYARASGLTVYFNPINANTNGTIHWTPCTSTDSNNKYLYTLIINSYVVLSNSTYTSTSLQFQPYVPFSLDNQLITMIQQTKHQVTGYVAQTSTTVRVLYKPTKAIQSLSPSNAGAVIAGKVVSTRVSWSYPSGQNGIVSKYKIILINPSNSSDRITYYSTSSAVNITTLDLKPMIKYTLQVYPVYMNGSTEYLGPVYQVTNYIYRLSGLDTSVIDYPINNGYWYGNTFRVAFKLPMDPTYQYLTTAQQQAYTYRNVEVKINNIVKSFTSNPTAFSMVKLPYKAGIIFNPILASYGLDNSLASYTVSIRVQSNYVDSTTPDSWSKWSNTITVKGESIVYPTMNQNDSIKLSHINSVDKMVTDLCSSYVPNLSYGVYDKILKDDFTKFYNNMVTMYNVINTYGSYDSTRLNVGFKNINTFTASVEEILSTSPKNYLRYMTQILEGFTQ